MCTNYIHYHDLPSFQSSSLTCSKIKSNGSKGVEVSEGNGIDEEGSVYADIMGQREVSIVVDRPVGGETKATVEEITEAEMTDENEDWILGEAELISEEPPPDSCLTGENIEEGDENQTVDDDTKYLNNSKHTLNIK